MPQTSTPTGDPQVAPEDCAGRRNLGHNRNRCLTARLLIAVAYITLTITLGTSTANAHTVGPQENEGGCLSVGIPGSGSSGSSGSSTDTGTLHKHDQTGKDVTDTLDTKDYSLPACVASESKFFASDLWTAIIAFSWAGAAILFFIAILKGASQMMKGQGTGLGQAIKSVLPLILLAALLVLIGTLQFLLIPLVGRIFSIILGAFNSLLPG